MCGIAGIWERAGRRVDASALERMCSVLMHRGPDGGGTFVQDDVGLGNRRLSILDLSPAGDQPMGLADRHLWLTYNGEIHNYLELRTELEARGARFRTETDTEVVLQAFAAWGTECFERFNGMWALAIWDGLRQTMVLSRDRFGVKPLYYSVRGSRVVFASEVKAILAAFPEERDPDGHEIYRFLAGRFTDVGEATFFKNVRALLPATYAVFRRDEVRQVGYWTYVPGTEVPAPDAEERFRHLLQDSVRLRMRSDTPVGACLSGGLDSTAVVRLMKPADGQAVHCFSLKYDETVVDESRYAARVAQESRTILHWVRPDPVDLLATIEKIVWHHDAPTPIRGRLPQWFVMREAGRHVKVVLDGQGGDELLAGYSRFVSAYLVDRLRFGAQTHRRSRWTLPAEAWALSRLERRNLRFLLWMPVFSLRRLLRLESWGASSVVGGDFARAFGAPAGEAFPGSRRRAGESETGPRPQDRRRPYRSHLNNALWRDFHEAGLPEVLHAEDALSMAFSLEARTPFLDHRLVEFCFSLPFDEKIRAGWTKSLLRRALADVLPAEIRRRRRKLGFPAPYAKWFRMEANLRDVRQLLLDRVALDRGIFDGRGLERRLTRFAACSPAAADREVLRLWRWVTLELWFRQFVDQPPSPLSAAS